MLSLICFKQCGSRCVLVVVDRTDLAQQACQEFTDLLERCFKIPISKQKTEQRPEVFQVNNAMELQKHFSKMVEDPKKRLVLTVTLQSFPHLRGALPKELEETTVVMADEVHRSHADKAFSEELSKVLGARPRLLLFTGTASDRCLRLFGEREGQHFVPFHSVAEETVPWKLKKTGIFCSFIIIVVVVVVLVLLQLWLQPLCDLRQQPGLGVHGPAGTCYQH